MANLFTTYRFKERHLNYVRPCGMSELMFIGQKRPTNADKLQINRILKKAGYAARADYCDDKLICLEELN